MSQRNHLPALNPILHQRNETHVVRPPQTMQIKRARFNRLPQKPQVQINEPITASNNSYESTEQVITVSPPINMPKQNKTNPRFRRQNDMGFIIGYRGEAYVYEMLQKEEKFKTVIWNALTDDCNNPCITTVNGNKYYIKEDGLHYDLFATDENGDEYYFEVKSTSSKNKEVTISKCQVNLAKELCNLNEHHVVAVVFNVNEDPSVIYYKKLNNLSS